MKNIHTFLIALIAVAFLSTGLVAQENDAAPSLKDQTELKTQIKKERIAQQELQSAAADRAEPVKSVVQQMHERMLQDGLEIVNDIDPNAKSVGVIPPSDDLFDLQFSWPAGVGGGEAGIETDGDYVYTTKWNGTGEFYRYGMDGTYIEVITIAGAVGIRDMAYNGTYFYGSPASTTVYEMDLANAALISQFTAPTACRAIAYNEDDDLFYANNWSTDITAFDPTGANQGSFATGPFGASYYGFAYDNYCGGKYLWGYAQVGATPADQNWLVQIELPSGVETGVTYNVASVVTPVTGIAGGLAITDELVSGYWTILGNMQNEFLWGVELCTSGPAPTNDVGIQSIVEPSSGANLSDMEPVTVMVKNYGTAAQSNFDVWFTLDGGTPVVETISATLNSGDTYEHTFATTVDLSVIGSYDFEACTDLAGDENAGNDCKTKTVTHNPPSFCAPTYSSGCSVGDGFTDFALEEIQNLANGCENNAGTGWSEYFSLGPATLIPGNAHTFTFGTGYSNQHVNVWIDFDDDYILTADEMILEDYILTAAGTLYDVDITIPPDANPGTHAMRIMAVWLNAFTDPCGSYSYGEAEDYTVNVITPEYGTLEGYVTENTGGAAIDGAMISVNNGAWSATSGSDGFYQIDNVLVGSWSAECTADGYNPAMETVTITTGGTTTQDFALTAPTMDITPASVNITLDPNAQTQEFIDIANNGDGVLDWSASLEMLTDEGGSKDAWDLLFSFDVEAASGALGNAGAECDGQYYYTTRWASNLLHKYDLSGNLVEEFSIPGVTGLRDLAFDGTYMYGGAAGGVIYEMDFTTQTLVSSISNAGQARSIAYDADNDAFWISNFGSDVWLISKAGATLNTIPNANLGLSGMYGSAFENITGTPYLYIFDQGAGAGTAQIIHQVDLTTLMPTGFTYDVMADLGPNAGAIAGGLFMIDNVYPGLWTIGGLLQGTPDVFFMYEFAAAGPVWLTISPTSGTLNAGNTEQMTLDFDATDIVPGTVKTANIHFMSDPDVGMVTVPVSMTVGDEDFGFISGTVTLQGSAPYNIGDVTDVMVHAGPYSATPDASGNYTITAYPGTYDVVAELYGYQTTTVTGITVVSNQTETVDISMPILYGMVSGTVTAATGGAAIAGATVKLVDTDFETTTAADGTYEFIVEAGTYDVKVTAPFYASQTAEDVVINAEATTTQDFQLTDLEGIIVVIDLDPTPNTAIVPVIEGFFPGGLVEYTTSITGYPLDEQVQTVFLLLGIFSNNYELTEADAGVITTWLDTYGGNLYMEGGDTWAYDTPTSLHSYFSINPLVDGTGDLSTATGIDSFWNGFTWSYVGENNYIDHIEAIAPAINVLENQAVGYYTGVAYDEGTYKTVGASHEITGLDDGSTGFMTAVQAVMGFFGYPVFVYGELEGTVTDADGGGAIENADISVAGGMYTTQTDEDGYYYFPEVLVGDWDVVCSATGYNTATATVTITEDDLTVQDFVLEAPAVVVDPLSIEVTMDLNETLDEIINISNPGLGSVAWSASVVIEGDGSSDDLFDLQFSWPAGVGGGEAGIETDGNYVYTTKWNGAGEFYRYQMDGTYLEVFTVAGAVAIRDLAYDGTYFYGGAAANTVYEVDLANEVLISQFTAPTAVRAIAYNEDENVFYANNWSTDIIAFDATGANQGSFSVGPFGASYYGLAYDGYSDGAPYLWAYAQVGASPADQNWLVQIELPSGTETGVTFNVATVVTPVTGIAGGLAISDELVPGFYTILGNMQNEFMWGVELCPAGPVWLSIDNNGGTLNGGDDTDITATFNTFALTIPGDYFAEIQFTTTPDVGSPVVDVILHVEGLVPPVNLVLDWDCTDIMLEWDIPAGGNPDSYNVYRDGDLIGNTTDLTHTDLMVDPEVEYGYHVTAVYGGDESNPTAVEYMTLPEPDDMEVDDLDGEAQGLTAYLFWSLPPCCVEPDGYNIFRDGTQVNTTMVEDLEYYDGVGIPGFYEYAVTAVYYWGESAMSNATYVLLEGVNELSATEFEIFPNPARDFVKVNSDYRITNYEILNNIGAVVHTENVDATNFRVDVARFESGIYYIKFYTTEGVALRKIAIE